MMLLLLISSSSSSLSDASSSSSTTTTTTPLETSVLFALIIGACIALIFLKHKTSSSNNSDNDKNYSAPTPPAGSKFVTISNNKNNSSSSDDETVGIKIRYEEHIPSSSSTTTSKGEDDNDDDDDDNNKVTLVFIHGHMGCLETWNLLLPHLLLVPSNNTIKKIITVDTVGFGYSDKATSKFTYSHNQQGDVLYQLLEKLNITNAILVGHSSGCIIASRVASIDNNSSSSNNNDNDNNNKARRRVRGIILTAPGGLFTDKPSFLSWYIMYPLCYFLAKTMLSKRRESLMKYHLRTDCLMNNEEELLKYYTRPFTRRLCNDDNGNDDDDDEKNNNNNIKNNDNNDIMIDKEAIRVVATTFAVKEEPYLSTLQNIHDNVLITFVFAAQDSIYDYVSDDKKKLKVDSVVEELKKKHNASCCYTIVVDDTNHYIQHEQPEKLARIILDVVNKACT